ncbi:MAG: O-antigen polymerase [Terracidiphilus sp.]
MTIANFFAGGRRVLYPPFIYSGVWAIDVAIFAISPIEINPVHSVTWWVITLGALAFSAGGWITGALRLPIIWRKPPRDDDDHPDFPLGRTLLVTLCVVCLPYLALQMFHPGASGGMIGSRDAAVELAEGRQSSVMHNPITTYLPSFSIWVAVLCLIEKRDWRFWIALATSFACCFLATGRTLFLLLLSAVTAVEMIKHRKDTIVGMIRVATLPFICFVAIFVAVIFLNKDTSGFRGDNVAILSNFFLAYVVVPIPALDGVLMHMADYSNAAHHTFEFLLKTLNAFGCSFQTPPTFDEWVLVPLPTNVYTIYKFYLTDFGLLGMYLAILVIGLLQTIVYRIAIAGSRIALFFCALLVFPAVMSIFDDSYSQFVLIAMEGTLAITYFYFLHRLTLGISLPRLRPAKGLPHIGFLPSHRAGLAKAIDRRASSEGSRG